MCIATDFVDIKRNYNSALEVLGVLITMKEHTAIKKVYAQALHEQEIFSMLSNRNPKKFRTGFCTQFRETDQ